MASWLVVFYCQRPATNTTRSTVRVMVIHSADIHSPMISLGRRTGDEKQPSAAAVATSGTAGRKVRNGNSPTGRRAHPFRPGLGGGAVRRRVASFEATSQTWADVQRWDDGSGRVAVVRSKTDVEAQGAVVAITPALDAIRRALTAGRRCPGCRSRRSPGG